MAPDSKTTKKRNLREIFLDVAKPNSNGFSENIKISDLVKFDPRFETGNGGHWCRDDGPLKEYNIIRQKLKNKIYAVRLDGYNKNSKQRQISQSIKEKICSQKCVVLDVGSMIECDHKDGKYDDKNVGDIKTQKLENFQPLSKNVNTAKRQHCKVCKDTNSRFDARKLGYKESYTMGDEKSKTCAGCYWYDPKEFNQMISSSFIKTK